MKTIAPARAGMLLVLAALLVGGAAMWSVDETTGEQAEEAPAAQTTDEGQPATPAATDDRIETILRTLSAGGPIPDELRDPAFDYYVDLSLLGNAWVELDSALLTDLALQVMEGERVLLRPHRAIHGADVMGIAIRLAAVKNDEPTLARLEKAVHRTDNESLARELAEAQKAMAEEGADSVWTVSVATTSAETFARYKGVLQDIEAAIVVRDQPTLESLQKELESARDLPQSHRAKLLDKVSKAIDKFGAEEGQVSRAAAVLDKLAHSTRRSPLATLLQLGGGGVPEGYPVPPMTQGPVTPTQCATAPTECYAVSTSCPEGSSPTQCPAVSTSCPPNPTECPSIPTLCQNTPTLCQNVATECQATPTQCHSMPTECQNVPTQCQTAPTQCQNVPTQCQNNSPTQCRNVPTQCQNLPTECVYVATLCQNVPTQCGNAPTQCQGGGSATQCQNTPTICPAWQTACPPEACQRVTQTPKMPTQCQSVQSKCSRPTLYPQIPTQCPAMLTSCPASLTYCPANCGQQQQKQRWIPPGKPPGTGQYDQYPPGQGAYPDTPYRRRDAYNWNP